MVQISMDMYSDDVTEQFWIKTYTHYLTKHKKRNPLLNILALQNYEIVIIAWKFLFHFIYPAHYPFNWSFGDLMTSFKMVNKIL